jgi:hypothetical protein
MVPESGPSILLQFLCGLCALLNKHGRAGIIVLRLGGPGDCLKKSEERSDIGKCRRKDRPPGSRWKIQPKGWRDFAAPMGQVISFQPPPRRLAQPTSPREAEIARRSALKKQRRQLEETR